MNEDLTQNTPLLRRAEKHIHWNLWIPIIVAVLGWLMVSFGNSGDQEKLYIETNVLLSKQLAEQRIAFNEQMESQSIRFEKIISKLTKDNIELKLQLVQVSAELNINMNKTELYQNVLNTLPFPAWIKRMDADGQFRMVMINEQFTSQYGITPSEYVGRTDFQVHPKELATKYFEADRKVLSSGKGFTEYEVSIQGGEEVQTLVYRFIFNLPNNIDGVAGVAVTQKLLKRNP